MKRHTFDPISFVFGIAFVGFAAAVVTSATSDYSFKAWLVPGTILLGGIGLLLATVQSLRTHDHPTDETIID